MSTNSDLLKTDLRLILRDDGAADIAWSGDDIDTVSGVDNLAQALTLRLCIQRGELSALGHVRYGGRVKDLLGEPLDRPSLELLRRYVRAAIKQDPRVEEVVSISARARRDAPGVVAVEARVKAVTGEDVRVELAFDLT